MEDRKKTLENLLLDIDILNELDKWINDINFFEISGMTNQEVKHSKTLSWFLDSNENHFLNDQFIRRFIQKIVSRNVDTVKDLDIFDVSLIDYRSFAVKREWRNVDILIYSNDLKIVYAIENKVYATESKGQLNKYYKIVNEEFKDFDKMFIYLTREGEEPSDIDNWCVADYRMVIEALEESLNANRATISNKIKIIINDYVSMIRRNFGMDNELKRTAQKIYLKHKKAFDLIFEVVTTGHAQFSDYIKNWLETNKEKYKINYNEIYSTNLIIRFTTPFIDELFPFDEEKEDGWGYGYSFMYEISISKYRIHLEGVLANPLRPNSQKLVDYIGSKTRATKWRRIMRAKPILSDEYIAEGMTEEVIEILNSSLNKAIKKHIYDFEKDLKEFIEKQ